MFIKKYKTLLASPNMDPKYGINMICSGCYGFIVNTYGINLFGVITHINPKCIISGYKHEMEYKKFIKAFCLTENAKLANVLTNDYMSRLKGNDGHTSIGVSDSESTKK